MPDDGQQILEDNPLGTDRDPGGDGTLLPRLRDVGHHRAGASRRARRPQAGAPADPLRHVRAGTAPRPPAQEVCQRGRSGDGLLPPARRRRDLRRAGAHGPRLLAPLPADRRARKLRLTRPQRPSRRIATPRRASHRSRCGCSKASTRTPSTCRPPTTAAPPSRSCSRRATPTCWSTAVAASRSGWPPTSRRTTCVRSSTRPCICSTTPTRPSPTSSSSCRRPTSRPAR